MTQDSPGSKPHCKKSKCTTNYGKILHTHSLGIRFVEKNTEPIHSVTPSAQIHCGSVRGILDVFLTCVW